MSISDEEAMAEARAQLADPRYQESLQRERTRRELIARSYTTRAIIAFAIAAICAVASVVIWDYSSTFTILIGVGALVTGVVRLMDARAIRDRIL